MEVRALNSAKTSPAGIVTANYIKGISNLDTGIPQNPDAALSQVFNSLLPMAATVKDRTYPYTVPVYAVTLKSNNNQENIQGLLNWILSAEGQKLIEETGYIPLKN